MDETEKRNVYIYTGDFGGGLAFVNPGSKDDREFQEHENWRKLGCFQIDSEFLEKLSQDPATEPRNTLSELLIAPGSKKGTIQVSYIE